MGIFNLQSRTHRGLSVGSPRIPHALGMYRKILAPDCFSRSPRWFRDCKSIAPVFVVTVIFHWSSLGYAGVHWVSLEFTRFQSKPVVAEFFNLSECCDVGRLSSNWKSLCLTACGRSQLVQISRVKFKFLPIPTILTKKKDKKEQNNLGNRCVCCKPLSLSLSFSLSESC